MNELSYQFLIMVIKPMQNTQRIDMSKCQIVSTPDGKSLAVIGGGVNLILDFNTHEQTAKTIEQLALIESVLYSGVQYEATLEVKKGTKIEVGAPLHGKVFNDRLAYFRDGTGIKTLDVLEVIEKHNSLFARVMRGTYRIIFVN